MLDSPPRDGCGTGSSQTGSRALEAAKGRARVSRAPPPTASTPGLGAGSTAFLTSDSPRLTTGHPLGIPYPALLEGVPPAQWLTSASSMAVPVVVPSTVGLVLVALSWSKVTMST